MRIDLLKRKRRRPKASPTIGSGRAPRPPLRRSTGTSSRALPGSGGGRLAPETEYLGRRRSARRGGRAQQGTIFPRRSRPAAIVRRAVLISLLVGSMALLTVSYRNTQPVSAVQMAVVEVVHPLERGLTRAWQPVQDSYDWFGRLFSATSENPRLEARVEELEVQLTEIRQVESQNVRLREMVGIIERATFHDGYRKVAGSVIVRPTAIDKSFLIDLGSNDGVSRNDPVIVPRGLVGRVEAVSPNTARVGLIINRQQAVSAAIEGSTGTGVLRAMDNEGSPVLELSYVSKRARVHKGDVVVTSGWSTGDLSSIYPKDIPVGVVTSRGSSQADLYQTVQVTPFADFDRFDEVLVLVATKQQEALVEPPTASASQVLEESADAPRKQRPKQSARGLGKQGAGAAKEQPAG
jgi:rod shape-determining protein MreC